MNFYNLPSTIAIFKIVSESLNNLVSVFKPETEAFQALKNFLNSPQPFSESESELLQNPSNQLYVQLLILLASSMDKSIYDIPVVQISEKDSVIRLTWKNGGGSIFTLGKYDDASQKYINTFSRQVLGLQLNRKLSNYLFFKRIQTFLEVHLSDLDLTQKQIQTILSNPDHPDEMVNTANHTLIFIYIAALPYDQLNTLLLNIQQHFPEELEVKNASGTVMNIASLFQTSSTDIKFLLEKVRVYFDLYTNSEEPIIQHITQSQTKQYLIQLLKNTTTRVETYQNLQQVLKDQLLSRIYLLAVFLNHLKTILD